MYTQKSTGRTPNKMGQKGRKSKVISLEKNRKPENIRCSISGDWWMEDSGEWKLRLQGEAPSYPLDVRPWCVSLEYGASKLQYAPGGS